MAVKYIGFSILKPFLHFFCMDSPEIKRLKQKTGIDILWIYVLSLLKKQSCHPYLLRKKISDEFNFLPGNVTVYVVLYKLKSRGYVNSRKQENKTVYSVSKKGIELLKEAEKVINEKKKNLFN